MKTLITLLKMVLVASVLLLVGVFQQAKAQDLLWSQQNGSSSDIREVAVDRDASGNIYTIGQFNGTFDIDPGPTTTNISSGGKWGVYVTKKSPTGSLLGHFYLTTTSGFSATDIKVDGSGNVVICGYKQGTVDFDPGSGTANLTHGNGSGYVAKYNSSLQYQWAAQTTSGRGVNANAGLAIDASGNVFTGGYNYEWLQPGGLASSGFNYAGYIIKYNASGVHQWTRSYRSSPGASITNLTARSNGNVIAVGEFKGNMSADYRSGSGSLSGSTSVNSGFITELNSSGSLVRLTKMNGTALTFPTQVEVDNSNNVIIAGVFAGTADFDLGSGISNKISAGGNDLFVAKYNSSFALSWVNSIGGTGNEGNSRMSISSNGEIATASSSNGSLDLDPGTAVNNYTNAGSNDAIIHHFDANGAVKNTFGIGGTANDVARGIDLHGNGEISVVGYFNGSWDIDPGSGTTTLTSLGNYDGFLAKYGKAATNSAPTAKCKNTTLSVSANCTASISAADINDGSSDPDGDTLTYSISPSGPLAVGTHTVTLTATDPSNASSSCTATITVVDNTKPVITCPSNVTVSTSTTACNAAVALSAPVFSDNCAIAGSNLPSIISHWPLNGNGNDAAGSHNGTGINSPTYATGNDGSAMYANNAGMHMNVPHNSAFSGTSGITVSAWIKPNSNTDEDQIVSKSTHGVPSGWEFRRYGQTLQFTFRSTNGIQYAASAGSALSYNTWQEVTGTWNGSQLKVYVNGVLKATSNTAGSMSTNSYSVKIGENQGYGNAHGAFYGYIDDVKIYNTALSASQVANPTTQYSSTHQSGSIFNIGTTTVTYTVADASQNSSSCSFDVSVVDQVAPVAMAQNVTVQLDATGNGSTTAAAVNNGSSDACGISGLSLSKTAFTCADVGANTVTLTITDNNNNVSTTTATVTVVDAVAPVATAQNVTVYLNASGSGSITANDVDNGSTDNCGITNKTLSKSTFACSDVSSSAGSSGSPNGLYFPSAYVINGMDNNGSNFSTLVSGQGQYTGGVAYDITAGKLYWIEGSNKKLMKSDRNGSNQQTLVSSGMSSPRDVAVDPDNGYVYFSDYGGKSIKRINTNGTGLTTIASGTSVQPLGIFLDRTNGKIYWADLGSGTIKSMNVNGTSITTEVSGQSDCRDVAFDATTSTLYWTIGNQGAIKKKIGTGSVSTLVSGLVNPYGVFFNDGDNKVYFTETTGGSRVSVINTNGTGKTALKTGVTNPAYISVGQAASSSTSGVLTILTVTDASGNSDTAVSLVTVLDTVAPNAIAQNVTVQLDATGNGSTTAAAVNNGSSDACGIASLALSKTAFTCTDVGTNTVTLTVTDNNNNVSTTTATVTVVDAVAPVATAQNVTVQLDTSGNGSTTAVAVNNGSSDACGITSLALSKTAFTCADVGTNTVTLTVTDNNNNVSTTTATVTVVDAVAPVATAQNVTVQLDATGNGSTTAAAVNNGSTDACGIAGLSLSKTAFTCADVGANTVTLTVTDNNANVSTTTATVTVVDAVAPVATAQNVTVQLDATGNGSTTAATVNNGSTDACGIATLALSKTAFDCSNVGANTVTLTVTDNNGNVSTTTATVTVVDAVAPVATAQNVTVQLDATGNGSTTAAAVNNGSTDACGIATLALSKTAFDCSNVGANTVTLTVTDNNGNVSTTTATVTVVDGVAPVATAQNVTVQLDATGNGSTTTAAVNNGSTDACGIASLALSKTAFDCSNVGANTVTLTVTDNNGNVSATTATVTVVDGVAPVANAQNVTVQLDATGNGSTTATSVNNGSSDACGIATLELSKTEFSCTDVGTNTVTLTVTDNNGNSSTATATVTVVDGVAPTAIAQNTAITLDSKGTGSIGVTDINNGSSDACGIDTMYVAPNYFTCLDTGANTVTLTVVDVNGNVSTSTATVTVTGNADFSRSRIRVWNVDCYGNSTGKLAAKMRKAGTPPYSFLWNTGRAKRVLKKVPAGVYTVQVTDSNGCWHSMTDTVTEPPMLVASIGNLASVNYNTASFGTSANVVLGYGNNKSVTLPGSATGGTPGYSYSWSPATGLSNPNVANPVLRPTLPPDSCHTFTYTLTVTDANGCTSVKSVDVKVVNVRYRSFYSKRRKGWGYGYYRYCQPTNYVLMCYSKTYYPKCRCNSGYGKKGKKGRGGYGYGKKCKHKPVTKYYTKKVKSYYVSYYLSKGYKLGSCSNNCGSVNSTRSTNDAPEEEMLDIDVAQEPSLFPNPNNGSFFIEIFDIGEEETVSLEIYDQLGKVIYTTQVETQGNYANAEVNLDEVANIESGFYFTRIMVGDRVYNKRFDVVK